MHAPSIHQDGLPAVWLMLANDIPRGDGQTLPAGMYDAELHEQWRQALSDFDEHLKQPLPPPQGPTIDVCGGGATAPSEDDVSAAAAPSQRPPSPSMEEFLAMTAELERMNRDVLASGGASAEEESRTLGADRLDPLMTKGLSLALRRRCEEASKHFSAARYAEALRVLEEVAESCGPTKTSISLINNLAVCQYKLERWPACTQTCERCLDLCPAWEVARRRLCRMYVVQDNLSAARAVAATYKQSPNWSLEWAAMKALESYHILIDSHQYPHAAKELQRLCDIIPCSAFEALQVAQISLESTTAALQYANTALARYPFSTELLLWRAELTLRMSSSVPELHEVLRHLQRCDAAASDARCRQAVARLRRCLEVMEELNVLIGEGRWPSVVSASTRALSSSGVNDGVMFYLLSRRAQARMEMQAWYDGLDDCHRAMSYTESDAAKAYLLHLMARGEEGLLRFKDALLHGQQSLALRPDQRVQVLLARVQGKLAEQQKRQQEEEGRQRAAQQEERERAADHERRRAAEHQRERAAGYARDRADEEKRQRAAEEEERRSRSHNDDDDEDDNDDDDARTNHYSRGGGGGRGAGRRPEPQTYANRARGGGGARRSGERGKPPPRETKRPPPPPRMSMANSHLRCLELPAGSDVVAVKRAYRAMAMKWHPDRWCGATTEAIQHAEARFKEMQNAYEQLMATMT